MSKILEEVAAKHLIQYPTDNDLHKELQSTYKPLHSIETALMRVQHNITISLAGSSGVFLLLLDFSAASILLKTIDDHLRISGSASTWFSSYMSDRIERMQIGSNTSNERPLR